MINKYDVLDSLDDENVGEEGKYKELQFRLEKAGFDAYYLYDGYSEYLEEHDAPIDKGREVFEKLLAKKKKYEF